MGGQPRRPGQGRAPTVADVIVQSRDQVLDLISEDGFDDGSSVTNSYSVRTELAGPIG
jgi:hypothetical protein